MRTSPEPNYAYPRKPAIDGRNRAAWAWTAFWDEQANRSRCLANAPLDVRRVLHQHWIRFAASLTPSAQVLDIGCGAGVVGKTMLAARSDLQVTGVDLARATPSADRRLRLMFGTAMEDLPFESHRFDAAVSQFGFEYGSVTKAAKQIARVLAPGALFSFIVHHALSPIVSEDRHRNRALSTILSSRVEQAFLAGQVARLDRELERVRLSSPSDAIVEQIADALRSRLTLCLKDRKTTWNAIVEALAPERELITALENSCVSPNSLDTWLGKIAGPLEILNSSELYRTNGQVIAWVIEGRIAAIPKTFV